MKVSLPTTPQFGGTSIQASLEVKSFTRIRLWQNNYIPVSVPVPWSLFEIISKGGSLVILKKVFAKFGRQFWDQSWKQSWKQYWNLT